MLQKKRKRRRRINWRNVSKILAVLLVVILGSMGYNVDGIFPFDDSEKNYAGTVPVGVKEYEEASYIVLNDNVPSVTKEELAREPF